MESTLVAYEPPELVEVGDFDQLTLGTTGGGTFDGGLPPFVFYA